MLNWCQVTLAYPGVDAVRARARLGLAASIVQTSAQFPALSRVPVPQRRQNDSAKISPFPGLLGRDKTLDALFIILAVATRTVSSNLASRRLAKRTLARG